MSFRKISLQILEMLMYAGLALTLALWAFFALLAPTEGPIYARVSLPPMWALLSLRLLFFAACLLLTAPVPRLRAWAQRKAKWELEHIAKAFEWAMIGGRKQIASSK